MAFPSVSATTISSQFCPRPLAPCLLPPLPFIASLQPLSGDDHLSSTGSHNRLVNALIAFSLCVWATQGRRSIIS